MAESEELEICEHVIMRLSGGRSISRLVQRSDKASISWHFFDLSSHPSNLRVLINSHCHNLKDTNLDDPLEKTLHSWAVSGRCFCKQKAEHSPLVIYSLTRSPVTTPESSTHSIFESPSELALAGQW